MKYNTILLYSATRFVMLMIAIWSALSLVEVKKVIVIDSRAYFNTSYPALLDVCKWDLSLKFTCPIGE